MRENLTSVLLNQIEANKQASTKVAIDKRLLKRILIPIAAVGAGAGFQEIAKTPKFQGWLGEVKQKVNDLGDEYVAPVVEKSLDAQREFVEEGKKLIEDTQRQQYINNLELKLRYYITTGGNRVVRGLEGLKHKLDNLPEDTREMLPTYAAAGGAGLLALTGGIGISKLVSAIRRRRKRKKEAKDMNERQLEANKQASIVKKANPMSPAGLTALGLTGSLAGYGTYKLVKLLRKLDEKPIARAEKAQEEVRASGRKVNARNIRTVVQAYKQKEKEEKAKQASSTPDDLLAGALTGLGGGVVIGGTAALISHIPTLIRQIKKDRARNEELKRKKEQLPLYPFRAHEEAMMSGIPTLIPYRVYEAIDMHRRAKYNALLRSSKGLDV